MRDKAADGQARERVEQWEHRLEPRAADVLEVDVDALRAGLFQLRRKLRVAAIEAIVKTEFLSDVVAFVLAAGDADRPSALDPRDLSDRRADRARSRRDHHGLADLRLAHIEPAAIGGPAG